MLATECYAIALIHIFTDFLEICPNVETTSEILNKKSKVLFTRREKMLKIYLGEGAS